MYFLRCYRAIVPMTVAISFLTVSCGESKVSQCQKIINVANQASTEAKVLTKGGQPIDPDAMVKAADTMDKAAQAMEAIKLSDNKLKEYQTGFSKMYRDTSTAMRGLVEPLKNKDRQKVFATLKNLRQAIVPEPQLVSGLNTYCNGK
ncbi:MAG TPA: hypothetical protein V6D12_07985 [Candidatus Obscuribacterales bacterium]